MSERAQALESALEKARRALDGFSAEIADGRVPVVGAVKDHLVLNLGLVSAFLREAARAPAVGVSPQPVQRFDLVSVNFAYTSDHEMERADDGEWVRFDDVFPLASPSPVEPKPPVHNDLCSWCLTQADHVAASEECYERNSERGRVVPKSPVEPTPLSERNLPPAVVMLVSAASAASGYLERLQPDLAARLWAGVQAVIAPPDKPVEPPYDQPGERTEHYAPDLVLDDEDRELLALVEPAPPTPAPCVWREITAEVEKATAKFPTWPTDPLHALAVLGEEFGELTKAVVQQTYEPHKNAPGELRKEAIQTAAMALRFAMSLDTYVVQPSAQHEQITR